MSWKTGSHACFLMLSALLTIAPPSAYGETFAGSEKVVSVMPDLAHGSITISTNSKTPLPAPLIQYLPGPDGKTILVADFEGISYQLATHLLKPENSAPDAWRQQGIQEIRIGQFSSQPPTMRISVAAFNARAFRTLAFHARAGALVMKWTPGAPAQIPKAADNRSDRVKTSIATNTPAPVGVAPLAPDYRNPAEPSPGISTYGTAYGTKLGRDGVGKQLKKPEIGAARGPEIRAEKLPEPIGNVLYKSTNSAPAVAPNALTRASSAASSEAASGSDERFAQKPPPAVARWLKDSESQSTSQDLRDEGQVTVSLRDTEQLKVNGATDVLVKTDKKLNYKTFRLHEPERYVIDFDGLPALQSAQLPPLSEELLVKGMRTGTPDDTGLTHRLVLDLKDNTVDVSDDLAENGTALNLRIRPSSSAPMPVQLKAQLVKDKLIVLDAGHGGSDPGAQRAGVSEKDLTMQITNQLKKRLTQLGARVVMTRSDDTFVSLEDRVKITNNSQPDLFVSIHINALESTSSIYGIETYYQTDQSRALATAIHQQLVQGLGVPDRSVRKARFYVINHTPIPAILAEVGFISNQQERDNLGAAEYQVKIADSVSHGIVQYLTEKQELAGKLGKAAF